MSKQIQWERKLLDLSLRNNLLNLRAVKNIVPLIQFDLANFENRLYEGDEFTIQATDASNLKFPDQLHFANLHQVEPNEQSADRKKLFAPMSEQALKISLTSLYRTSRSSIEESGANTLYIALGLLEWFEPKTDKARYAPLILLPMEIVRQSAASGYKIRQRDEDAMINTTLLEFLKQDFGIRAENLDPLPTDENGLDIPQIFAIFEQAISTQANWRILQSAYLGIFSFSQYVMWNDLRNRTEQLAQNKLVRSLMDGKLAWEAESMQIPTQVSYPQGLVPISADASQLFAIQSASEGKSFVLHGPPGTGKSQTITGIIADSLAQGKTILFASEKMAALSVVQNRMTKLGLGDFCLELHSNKSKKKDVLSQLMRATERVSTHNPQEYLDLLAQTETLKKSLDRYAEAMHKSRPSGYSLHQMLSQYENNKEFHSVAIEDVYAQSITISKLQEDLATIGELVGLAQSLGNIHDDPLRYIGTENYDPSLKAAVLLPAQNYHMAIQSLSDAILPIIQKIQGRKIISHGDLEHQFEMLQALSLWNQIPSDLQALRMEQANILPGIIDLGKEVEKNRQELLCHWKESLLEDSGELLLQEWREIQGKGFFGKIFNEKKIIQRMNTHARATVDKDRIEPTLQALSDYQAKEAELKTRFKSLPELSLSIHTDWQRLSRDSESLLLCLRSFERFPQAISYRNETVDIVTIQQAYHHFEQARAALDSLIQLREPVSEDFFASQLALCDALENRGDYLREWIRFNAKIRELARRNLSSMESTVFSIEPNLLEGSFKKSLFSKLVQQTLVEDRVLSDFSGAEFDVKVAQLKSLDKAFKEICKAEIYYRLAARVPDFTKEASQSSELGILQRALRSGGRGVSIRKLFQQIPTLLPRLCPCMLMSPISCAQYLDAGGNYFDLIVFDEASQLPTAKAVGVLARGKEAIIVGDPKQMPPTSFFGTDNIDEENLENEDLESILDDTLALSMPQTHLLWHYRSRHESLIAFSNHQFYESKLYTFPSSDDGAKMVRFVPSEGIFDRGNTRTNRMEAQKIVDEVIARWQNPSKQKESIGIVTFNIAQQNLIEDLLEEAYAQNPDFDRWATQAEEPLFVKNLENVQGDERDVILFSIGFGPDMEGKIYMNFGPLNQDGGWRRLNVAITRSRKEMVIFSSLNPEHIDLSKTQSEGVAALRAFLEFAKTGQYKGVQTESKAFGIISSVADFLKTQGYQTIAGLGQSKFKIDLAVVDPSNPEKYLLGILSDGGSYKDAKTTIDRELSAFSVLKGLGWNLHRLWSVDYWENPGKEQDKILALLKKIEAGESIEEQEHPFDKSLVVGSGQEEKISTGTQVQTETTNRSAAVTSESFTSTDTLSATEQNALRNIRGNSVPGDRTVSENVTLPNSDEINPPSKIISGAKEQFVSPEHTADRTSPSAPKRPMTKTEQWLAEKKQRDLEKTQATQFQFGNNTESEDKTVSRQTNEILHTNAVSNNSSQEDEVLITGDFTKSPHLYQMPTEQPNELQPEALIADLGIQKFEIRGQWIEMPYQTAKLRPLNQSATTFAGTKNFSKIVEYAQAIVEAEAPIHEELLIKRMTQSFGIARMSSTVQQTIIRAVNYCKFKETIHRGVRYFWRKEQSPESYVAVRSNHGDDKREIGFILDLEIQNAIQLVLQEQLAIPHDALIKETGKKLGFSRMTPTIHTVVEEQLAILLQNQQIKQEGEKLRLM